MELSLKTGWHQAEQRVFRGTIGFKPFSAYCITTHFNNQPVAAVAPTSFFLFSTFIYKVDMV